MIRLLLQSYKKNWLALILFHLVASQSILIGMQKIPALIQPVKKFLNPRFVKNAAKFLETMQTGAKQVETLEKVEAKVPIAQRKSLFSRTAPKFEAKLILPEEEAKQPAWTTSEQESVNQFIKLSQENPKNALVQLSDLHPALVMNMYTMHLTQQIKAHAERVQQQNREVNQLKQEQTKLREKMKSLQEAAQKRVTEAIEAAKRDVEREKAEAATELQRLKQETEANLKKIQETADQELKKREQLIRAEFKKDLEVKKQETEVIQKEIKKAQDAERYAQTQTRKKANELTQLQSELKKMRDASYKAEKAEEALVEYKKNSEFTLTKAQQEKETAENKWQDLNKQYEELTKSQKQQEQELANIKNLAEKRDKELKKALDAARALNNALSNADTAKNSRIELLQQKLITADQKALQAEQLQKSVQEKDKQLQSAQAEAQKTQKLEEQTKQQSDQIAALEKRAKANEEEREKIMQEQQNYKKLLDESQKQIEQSNKQSIAQNQEYTQKITYLEQENAKLQKHAQDLQENMQAQLMQASSHAIEKFKKEQLPKLIDKAQQRGRDLYLESNEYKKLIGHNQNIAVEEFKKAELQNLLENAKKQGEDTARKEFQQKMPQLKQQVLENFKNSDDYKKLLQKVKQVDKLQTQADKQEQELANMQSKMQQQIQESEKKTKAFTTENDDLKAKNQQLTQSITDKQKEAQEQYKKLNEQFVARETELKRLTDQIKRYETVKQELEHKDTQLVEIKNQLQPIKDELATAKQDVTTHKNQLQQIKQDIDHLLQDIEANRYEDFKKNFRDFAKKWRIRPESGLPFTPPFILPTSQKLRRAVMPELVTKTEVLIPTAEPEKFTRKPRHEVEQPSIPEKPITESSDSEGKTGIQPPTAVQAPEIIKPSGEIPASPAQSLAPLQPGASEVGRTPGIYQPTTKVQEPHYQGAEPSESGDTPYQPYLWPKEAFPELSSAEPGLYEGISFGEPLAFEHGVTRPIERVVPLRPVELGKDVPMVLEEAKAGIIAIDEKIPSVLPSIMQGYQRTQK